MNSRVKSLIAIILLAISSLRVQAQGTIATVPYSCDFENAVERTQWAFRNGTQANKWYVDTAVNNGGEYSLYVSNTNGVTHNYDNSSASYTWACRQIGLVAGLYNVSFDWKAQGYTTAHYMRAYLVPSAQFNGNAGSTTGFQTSGAPIGWIPLNSSYPIGAAMNLQSRWQNVYIGNVSVLTTGTYYIVFGWVNTSVNTTGLQPPAAVDNIQITKATCPRPDNLSVIATTVSGNAQATWTETGTATRWLLEYSQNSAFQSGVRRLYLEWPVTNRLSFNQQTGQVTYGGLSGFQPYTSYYFRVRALCDTTAATGDSSMTSVVFNFRFCPSNVGCIDFTNLTGPNCVCSHGTTSSSTLPPSGGWGNTGPYATIGVVDNGPRAYLGSNASLHTVHTDATAMDSMSNYQLPQIPPGECASVRLGCARAPRSREASAITYDFVVDTAQADIIVLKYALVTYNPSDHSNNEQPRFTMQLLDNNNNPIDPICGVADFVSSQAASLADRPGSSWHSGRGSNWYWKDWTTVGLDVSRFHGQTIRVSLATFTCTQGAQDHTCYAYFTLGCTKARITSTSCGGGSVSTTLTAPEGFNYRWYTGQNPNQTVSTQQTVTVQLDSTMYYCEVSFVDNPQCKFTMSTLATLRYPRAMFTGTTSTDSCIYRLRLQNQSRITSDRNDTAAIGQCESYFWDFGNGQTSTAENPVVTYSQPGTYTVKLIARINDGECADTITHRYTFRPPLTSRIIAPRRICYGDTAFLRAATPNYVEYKWSTGYTRDSLYVVPDSTTEYTLIARDSIGCVDTMRAKVTITDCNIYDTICRNERYLSYGFNISANTLRNFADTMVVFERHVRSSFGVDSVTILNLQVWDTFETVTYDTFCYGDPYTFYDIPLTRGGRYSQRFSNIHGCDSIIYLELEELPRPTLSLHHSYVPCFNYPITLIATRTGSDWIRWSSSPNDTSMSGYETQDTLVVKPHQRTIYTAVTGRDNYPCTTTAQTIVNLETDLKAYIHTSQEAASYDNFQVIFTDRSTDNTGRQWYLHDYNMP
ncbi:MAG: PKD domain-containing protein, partial [Bacteroidales bacterium]|nr:PKD domain-containing protein [Bacteroidales bacterium]